MAILGGVPRRLEDEIRITALHEIAHHFGIDEERRDELGWSSTATAGV
jgi:predicted Zn-dependent protease with MMP-like domain